MADQDAVFYLKQNKNRFPIDSLKHELINSGFSNAEIEEAITEAFPVSQELPKENIYLSKDPAKNTVSIAEYVLLGKPVSWHLELSKIPILAISIWAVIVFLWRFIPVLNLITPLLEVLAWIISIAAGFYVGYKAVKQFNASYLIIIASAVLGGLIGGLVKGLFNLINLTLKGDALSGFFSLYGLFLSPVFEAIIWTLVALITWLILYLKRQKERNVQH